MNNSTSNITPLELASLAARFNNLPSEKAVEKALSLYDAACAKLTSLSLDPCEELKNRADTFEEFLMLLLPERNIKYLRDKVIEWRFETLSKVGTPKTNSKPYTLEDAKKQIVSWENGNDWEELPISWGDFKKFVEKSEQEDDCRKENAEATRLEKTYKAHLENVSNTNLKKTANSWLEIAKTGGNSDNPKHQEFIRTIRRHQSNAGSALNNMGIYLSQKTIDQCVAAVKELDQKKVRTALLTSKITSKRRN